MKILITGSMGFTGRHLFKHLVNKAKITVFTTDINVGDHSGYYTCDLTDYTAVVSLINRIEPDQIYHLAGTLSNDYAIDYLANVITTKMLLDAVLSIKHQCRILVIGSSGEYGLVRETDNPVKETHSLNPVSIYGLTKVYQTHLMNLYTQVIGSDVVMARVFNLFGKGISERLFVGRVYRQIADVKEGRSHKITVGNLESRRDYIDVNRAVRYYELIMNKGISGEIYNVGTGCSIKMRDLLRNMLIENQLSMSMVEETVYTTKNKLDIPDIVADISKLKSLECDDVF